MRQDYQLVTVRGLFDSKESYADKTVTVGGWIRNNRDSKSIGFIALADGSCFQNLQLVYSGDLENFAQIAKMNVGAAIIATGKIVLPPNAKQPLEMQVEKIKLEGAPPLIIRCRRSATASSTSERSRTFVPAPILLRQLTACAP